MTTFIPNEATDEGRELGRQMARLCEIEIAAGAPDRRCATCAFRSGDHLANGSAATLMSATKCAMEGTPFWCHEEDRACGGWAIMRVPKGREMQMPWEHPEGSDATPPEEPT